MTDTDFTTTKTNVEKLEVGDTILTTAKIIGVKMVFPNGENEIFSIEPGGSLKLQEKTEVDYTFLFVGMTDTGIRIFIWPYKLEGKFKNIGRKIKN